MTTPPPLLPTTPVGGYPRPGWLVDKKVAIGPAEPVARRIRAAQEYVPPERLIVAPDCGMKYLPRDAAFAKLCALLEGARLVRAEIEGEA